MRNIFIFCGNVHYVEFVYKVFFLFFGSKKQGAKVALQLFFLLFYCKIECYWRQFVVSFKCFFGHEQNATLIFFYIVVISISCNSCTIESCIIVMKYLRLILWFILYVIFKITYLCNTFFDWRRDKLLFAKLPSITI